MSAAASAKREARGAKARLPSTAAAAGSDGDGAQSYSSNEELCLSLAFAAINAHETVAQRPALRHRCGQWSEQRLSSARLTPLERPSDGTGLTCDSPHTRRCTSAAQRYEGDSLRCSPAPAQEDEAEADDRRPRLSAGNEARECLCARVVAERPALCAFAPGCRLSVLLIHLPASPLPAPRAS